MTVEKEPKRLQFSPAKAEYLLNYTTQPGQGGDKRRFWREVMGFSAAADLREAILSQASIQSMQVQGDTPYGTRYVGSIVIKGPSGVSRQIRTVWIVLFEEEVASFVTAHPERSRRQE